MWEEVGASIARCLDRVPAGRVFARREGREVFREAEFCGRDGWVFRMDRVVVDGETVTIVDYKTGADPDPASRAARAEADRAQIRNYEAILREIYPGRRIAGTLVRIDEASSEDVA